MRKKEPVDLTLLADDRERQAALDVLSQAYADSQIDMAEHERRSDVVLKSGTRRIDLATILIDLKPDFYPKPDSRSPAWPVIITILALIAALTLVIHL